MSTFLSRSLLISHHHPPTPHPHPLTPHPQQQETKSFHFIFVLDESRSIGTHWSYLETAYRGFLTRRNDDQGGDDHFTVILFDHNARIILPPHQRLSNTPNNLSTLNGGGTAYSWFWSWCSSRNSST